MIKLVIPALRFQYNKALFISPSRGDLVDSPAVLVPFGHTAPSSIVESAHSP